MKRNLETINNIMIRVATNGFVVVVSRKRNTESGFEIIPEETLCPTPAAVLIKVGETLKELGQDNGKICKHEFNFIFGSDDVPKGKHCEKCDYWEAIKKPKKLRIE